MRAQSIENPALRRAVSMVNSSTSGLHVNDIAKRLKLSQKYTKDTLANARRRGLIGLVRASRQSVWVPLHLADAIAKAMAEEFKRKERECDRRRRLRLAERIDEELDKCRSSDGCR